MFHDALKTKAQKVVDDKYSLNPDWDCGFSQATFYVYVLRQTQEYIENFSFLHQGEDDQVCNHGLSSCSYYTLVDIGLTRGKKITSITQPVRFCT